MLLFLLAEAVNHVADHPQYAAMADDSPHERKLGYRVGPFQFQCTLTEAKRDFPEIAAKKRELDTMTQGIRLPLQPFPAQQREREMLARRTLLQAAVHVGNAHMRQETAKWITFLGRLRAAPDGSLIISFANEPEDYGFYL